jgi:hypothetical protein
VTPLQVAITLVLTVYADQLPFLTPREQETLRDVLAARLAADYMAARGDLLCFDADDWGQAA